MKIIISGTTGVGKSTTVKHLKEILEKKGKKVIIAGELVIDSPYFDLYFNNLVEWGFLAQLDFLLERFEQYFKIVEKSKLEKNKDIVYIFDRHFLEDLIFAELKWVRENTSAFLTNAYRNLYNELIKKLSLIDKPDFIFNLKASFDEISSRMKERGRELETKFSDSYWQDLYYRYYAKKSYRKTFKTFSNEFVEIDTDDLTALETSEIIYNKMFGNN